jgi:hypothetical protein
MYKRNIEARSCNHCGLEKAISIQYSMRVFVAIVIQHAERMRNITLSSVACLAVQNVLALSHKQHGFRK